MRDFFWIKPGNLTLHPEWRLTTDQRENSLARRHTVRGKDLSDHTKTLVPLDIGQVVLVQNQTGKNPSRWDSSGQIVEVMPFNQYKVKIDGTGKLSLRNRRFLRAILYCSRDCRRLANPNPKRLRGCPVHCRRPFNPIPDQALYKNQQAS